MSGASTDARQIVIVGGGPAGLAAALLAAEAGHGVTLLERSERLGGMAASIDVSGQRVDLGSHRLHPSASDEVLSLVRRLIGDDLQTRARNGRMLIGSRWVRFPLSPVDMARRLPPRFVAAAARDTILAPLRRPRADTYAEVVRVGLGPATLAWFYGPFALKLWGLPPEQLHGDIARRRIAVRSAGQLAAKLLRAQRSGPPLFLYPRHGYGQVVDALAERATAAGARLVTNASVTELVPGSSSTVRFTTHDETHELSADQVLWTAAPHHLADVVPDGPAGHRPTHRAMVLVFLTLDVDRFTPFDAHYLPGSETIAARVSEPKNYRNGDDPAGQTVLCAEIACDVGDAVWNDEPWPLAQRVLDELIAAGARPDDQPVPTLLAATMERLPAVYPVIGPDDRPALDALTAWAQSIEGVTVFGRQGLVVADNLHHVLAMAIAAVTCLDGQGGWDHRAWAEALERFDAHVVED